MHHLVYLKEPNVHPGLCRRQCAWIGFPLYTDAMPGVVKHFFEALEPLAGRKGKSTARFRRSIRFPRRTAFALRRTLPGKTDRPAGKSLPGHDRQGQRRGRPLDGPYANPQPVRRTCMPGGRLGPDGKLDPQVLARIAAPERFPLLPGPVFRIFLAPAPHSYFDGMLKKNGAYERRFAKPFTPES